MPLAYPNIPIRVGCTICVATSVSATTALNSANARLAHVRRLITSGTLQKLRIYIVSVTGTPSAGDIKCQLYSGEGDTPATAIGTEVSLSSLSGAGYYDFDFSSQNISLSAGTRYWFVMRNANASPASNYVTISRGGSISSDLQGSNYFGAVSATSTDGGSTWSYTPNVFALIVHSNGAEGFVYYNNHSPTSSGNTMHGVKFTTPANAKLRVAGLVGYCTMSSPASPAWALYSSSGLVAEAAWGNSQSYSGTQVIVAPFSSIVTLETNTDYYFVAKCSSGTVTFQGVQCDSSTENLNQLPLGARYAYTTNDGSTWTVDTTRMMSHWALLLDPDQPFESVGGGGGGGGFPVPSLYRRMI